MFENVVCAYIKIYSKNCAMVRMPDFTQSFRRFDRMCIRNETVAKQSVSVKRH